VHLLLSSVAAHHLPPFNSHCLRNICVFSILLSKLYCLLHVLCFIVFSVFFMLSVGPLCSIVLLPFLAILTKNKKHLKKELLAYSTLQPASVPVLQRNTQTQDPK